MWEIIFSVTANEIREFTLSQLASSLVFLLILPSDIMSTYFFTVLVCLLFKKSILTGTQPAITCSKLTIETLEHGVKYIQC